MCLKNSALLNSRKFAKEFRKIYNKKEFIRSKRILFVFALAFTASSFLIEDVVFRIILLFAVIIAITTFYLLVFVKAVENACMLKYVKPTELTEGDWIAKNVRVNGKYICGPKDL